MTASTTYIKWPIEIDAAFCAAYAALTGETIAQDQPRNDTHIETGSSRITSEQIEALRLALPHITFSETPTLPHQGEDV